MRCQCFTRVRTLSLPPEPKVGFRLQILIASWLDCIGTVGTLSKPFSPQASTLWSLCLDQASARGHIFKVGLGVKNTFSSIPILKHCCDIVSDMPSGNGIFILTFYLTFYPASILTNFLTFFFGILFRFFPTFYLASFQAFIPAFFLAYASGTSSHNLSGSFWHSIWYIFEDSLVDVWQGTLMRLRSGREHSHPKLAVEVWQGTL